MAEISGSIIFNERLSTGGIPNFGYTFKGNFYSGGTYFNVMFWNSGRLFYRYRDDSSSTDEYTYEVANTTNKTVLEEYRNVNFGTEPQTIEDKFYNWIIANSQPVPTKELKTISIRPLSQYIVKGEEIQFKLTAIYDDESEEDVTDKASWGLVITVLDEPVETLNGCSISNTGLFTAIAPDSPYVVVAGKYGGYGQYSYMFTYKFPGTYAPGGVSAPSGGKGKYDGGSFGEPSTSDDIASELPTTSTFADASSSGTYTKYLVNNTYLEVFGDWLWNTSFGLSIAQEVIKLIYGDPSESIISLMAYPFQLTGINGITYEQRDFYWGNHNAGFQVPALTSTSGQINWGTLTFDEYWGNFLDYSPHTKIQLYLPWGTGFVDINPDEVLPGTMTVVTTIELDKGSCVHNVFNHVGNVIGSYSGQCGKHVALMASDFSSKLANIAVTAVSAGVTLGAGITAGGVSKVISDAGKLQSYQVGFRGNAYNVQFQSGAGAFFSGAKESVPSSIKSATHAAKTSLAANKSPAHVIRNGSFTDSSAGLGIQFPYVILSRPTQSVPEQYGSYEGYPSNIYTQLRTLRGYTEISEIHLTDFESATVDEINKLEDLLKGGVIF